MTEIPALYGQCKIASLVGTSNPHVGVSGFQLASVPVSLGQVEQTWKITSQPSGNGLRFSIGEFPYTGVDQGTVIATHDVQQDVEWYVTYRKSQGAYSIEPGYDQSTAWTVSDYTDPVSPITIEQITATVFGGDVEYSTSQLFKPQQPNELD